MNLIRIALSFPVGGFFPDAEEILQEYVQYNQDTQRSLSLPHPFDTELVMREVVVPQNRIDAARFGNFDVIISRGITAELLKHTVPDIPVVAIPVVGNDLIRAVFQAKHLYGVQKAAVLGSQSMIFGIESLSDVVGMELHAIYRRSDRDVAECVDRAVAMNCTVIIGGVETCTYAKELGLHTLIIHSGRESLWQAIAEADRVAQVRLKEQARAQSVQAILNYSSEGIVKIDEQGIISLCNSQAENILHAPRKIVGRSADDVFPADNPMNPIIHAREHRINEIVNYFGVRLSVTRVPIVVSRQNMGTVLTFQKVEAIQKAEHSIRRKIYAHGMVAKHTFADIIGQSPSILTAIGIARKYAAVDFDVLISGPSGTGKELFAQGIHNASSRRKGPFVAVNCAAIPSSLLESELFGYVEGAFTGSSRNGKVGLFEQAHGGTIFLDEIAEMSTALQCKLLRVLQEREIMRLGDDKVIPVNIRVIAATNKDLKAMVRRETFREDLYFRLNVLPLQLPSLQERTHDASRIAEEFFRRHTEQFHREMPTLTPEAKEYLDSVRWYGNVRELLNLCIRVLVLLPCTTITRDDLQNLIQPADGNSALAGRRQPAGDGGGRTEPLTAETIRQTLRMADNNKTKAARLLGISRTTLWKYLSSYER